MTRIRTESGVTDGGGLFFEVVDDNEDRHRIELEPTNGGKMRIAVETPDGERKSGVVEPGAATDRGLGT